MQIFSPAQIREWDLFTIEHEPVSSLALMERAAGMCISWLEANLFLSHPFTIFCGKGNNGGDGLAIARLLSTKNVRVTCYILELGHKGTEDFQANLARLHGTAVNIIFIQSEEQLHLPEKDAIIIDAVFGSGLNRPPENISAKLIRHINQAGKPVIAIDIPSGMFSGKTSQGNEIVKAGITLSFQSQKLAFLMPENEGHTGEVIILDIGLHKGYPERVSASLELLEKKFLKAIYQPRKAFAHKGNFGHSLLIGGSYGKMGAILLACRACLRSGTGLLSSYIPACGYDILQTAVPEAMVMTSPENDHISKLPKELIKYNAVGIGPGLGTAPPSAAALEALLDGFRKPVVIDADALNLISMHPELLEKLPPFSILTPHPKEFERLFGKSNNDFEKMMLARDKAKALQVVILLKGHFSFIAMPGGKGYFNTTGNAGMATGGSGDVLTGILTSLLAQGYQPGEAAILGVYLHGLAGDCAAKIKTQEAMIASDIVEFLPEAFRELMTEDR